MDTPKYVLKTTEAVLMPVKERGAAHIFKTVVWIVVGVIIVGSLIFQENLFSEFSWSTRCLLITLVIVAIFSGSKNEYFPSPMELQFFDDYLVLYLPKRYYSKRVTRMEINRMNYSDISKCVFKTESQRIHLYGNGISTWYNYQKDGTLPSTPTKTNAYTNGLIYFNIRLAPDVDFKAEIENHSPLKVIIEKS